MIAESELFGRGANSPGMLIARLERLPRTFWYLKARIIVGTATFFDGFDAITIAYVLPVLIGTWRLEPSQIGLLISSGYIGQVAGAILFGWLGDRWGRIPSLVLAIALFGLMSLACALAWDYNSLFAFRTIQGVGLGGEVPVAASYISEMARARGRGRFFLLYESVFACGLLVASLMGLWLVPNVGWQSMFIIGAVPALLVFPVLSMLPESARWLIGKQRLADAAKVVETLEADTVRRGFVIPPVDPASIKPPVAWDWRWSDLFKGIYLNRTLVVWVIWFCTYLVTYGIVAWLPSLYRTVYQLDLSTALQYTFITQLGGLIGAVGSAFLFDRFSRRRWFGMVFLCTSLPLAALWLEGATSAGMVMLCATISAVFTSANAGAAYVYSTEIYPTRFRAFGVSIATAWVRIGSAIGPLIVGFMLSGYGLGAVFLLFALVAIVGAIVAGAGSTDSRERVLEEISP
ncbi:MAG TPA: MFS transporter [Stellaceae bacterium]|nr:MFS transporter [Stellaceae bacterium]